MDAFYGYKQIKIFLADEHKTTLITDQDLYSYRVMPRSEERRGNISKNGKQGVSKLMGRNMEA
jgi:hypothetical protein